MDCEIPEVIEGQTSINELLVAMGERPVEHVMPQDAPDDAADLCADGSMLPGF
jgi:hypothetical protein